MSAAFGRMAVGMAKKQVSVMAQKCQANPEACKANALSKAKFVGNMRTAVRPQGTQTAAPAAPEAPAAGGPGKMTVTFGSKGLLARKDGRYYLHKGEKVVAKRSVPKVTKAMQKDGMRVRHKGEAAVKKVPFVALSKLRKMGNGGAVLKTGLHVLKAGQRVIPASKVAKAKKAIKKA